MELAVNDFMGIFEEAKPFSMGSIDFGLSDIDYLRVFEEFRRVKGGLRA